MYCVCLEHVELAIDKFVDEYEDAPDLVSLETTVFSAWTPPELCEWCGNSAKVLVAHSSMTPPDTRIQPS